ncbi:Protein kinase superfamily protein with octicosapeptide/Phox/Bem1p domain [Euphorbia peplus]|nr:Protein kinase superfamily protein with octicosapeptide/Phox/Bem1p domain [Euphorbia peplus]
MERNAYSFRKEEPDERKQSEYNNAREPGPGLEALQPAPHAVFLDHTSRRIYTNTRLPDPNVPQVRPVLNYSMQTGEEFAFEFMRDRVSNKKPLIPNALGDPNPAGVYVELKAALDAVHTGSATEPEKNPKGAESTNLSQYGSVRSAPTISREHENPELVHGSISSVASGISSLKMKVLCSFGGAILPRPGDGKLRYVGGDTRIIRISREIQWSELKRRTLAIYSQPHIIKYQLPGEDLDALVSVSCDEDLWNMMEEWNQEDDTGGSKKFRMFLSSATDLEDAQFGMGSMECDSDIQYVVAINGMDLGSRRNSMLHDLATSSANNLNELDGLNMDRETIRPASVSVGVSSSRSTSTFQTAQPVPPNSSNSYETNSQFYHGQMINGVNNQQFQPQYRHDSSNYAPSQGVPDLTSLNGYQEGGLREQQSRIQAQNKQISINESKPKPDGSFQHEIHFDKSHPLDKAYAISAGEVPISTAAHEDLHSLPSKDGEECRESEDVSSSVDATNLLQVPKSCEDDQCSVSSSTLDLDCGDSVSNLIDLNYLEPSVPQRIYYSERVPRDQADLMNRLSKSQDSHGSQFIVSHSHSDVSEQKSITESAVKVGEINLTPNAEHAVQAAKPLHVDPQPINQKNKNFADVVSQINKSLPDSQDVLQSGFKLAIPNGANGSPSREAVLKAEHDYNTGDRKKLPMEETGEASSGNSAVPEVRSNDVSQGISPVGVSVTKQSDISIDINDRFPRDFISEIFSREILTEDRDNVRPIHEDGTGMSVMMENRDPKHWSYFHNLAKEEFVKKNVSLMDQDHLGTPSFLAVVKEGDQKPYDFAGVTTEGLSLQSSQHNFGDEDIRKNLPGAGAADYTVISDFNHSQIKDSESVQFGAMMEDLRPPESKGAKLDNRKVGLPLMDPTLLDVDISDLQIIRNDDLEELRELGSGTFGTVYHGKWRGSDVAIKRLKKICFTGRSSEQERLTVEFWREAEILSKLHHPNVLAFYGVVQDGPGGTLATVAEYMVDGSLRHVLLKKDRYLDRRKRLLIAMDAAFGMEYLHSKNIVHFDLKCDNLLVNLKDPQRPICKVGDFGLSKIKRNTLVSGGVRGTLPWMAPELLNGGSSKVSEKVDVFSFGIVLWEILTGEEPYSNMHYGAIIGGIVNNSLRPTIPKHCDPEWKRLMEQCWSPNPLARPAFTEIAGRLRIMSTAAASQTKVSAAAASQIKGHTHKPPK